MAIPNGEVKALKLRPAKNDLPNGRRGWCGPTVLASITGRKLSVIHELIRTKRYGTKSEAEHGGYRRGPVTGTSSGDLNYVLNHYGLRMWRIAIYEEGTRPTLAAWLKECPRHPETVYIVDVGFRWGHWTAIKGRKFVDTFTSGQPVWLKDAPHRRKRIRAVWVVTDLKS